MNDLITFDPGEKPLLIVRKHWIIFVRDVAISLVLGVLPFAIWQTCGAMGLLSDSMLVSAIARYLGLLWLLVVWIAVFVFWTEYYLDVWVITDRRLFNLQQLGLFHRQASSCELEDVQEVVVRTDNFFQTFFHYGTVQIQTAGPAGDIVAEGIPHPERIRQYVRTGSEFVSDLQDKNKKQEQLLHMVAHEVKGYLGKNAAVLASIAEGDYGAVPDPLKDTAQAALSDTRTGVNTVMDILEGSNLGAGTVHYDMKPFDLRAALAAVVSATRELARSKGLVLEFVDDGVPYMVAGDETKIRDHVLRNLVENAVRYTPKGSVSTGVSRVEGNVVAWVKDTGVGITPEDMQKLFTEGGHGAQSRAVNPSSTGFGLFIAKQIIDAHQGHIWAESDGAGTGSRFYLLLPLYNAAL